MLGRGWRRVCYFSRNTLLSCHERGVCGIMATKMEYNLSVASVRLFAFVSELDTVIVYTSMCR